MHIRYKVLTYPALTSTGLAHSTIIKYKKGQWNYPAEYPRPGKEGPGGLWASRNKSQAKRLQKYLLDRYDRKTIIFVCIINKILYQSSYRTKTDRLFLIEKIGN